MRINYKNLEKFILHWEKDEIIIKYEYVKIEKKIKD